MKCNRCFTFFLAWVLAQTSLFAQTNPQNDMAAGLLAYKQARFAEAIRYFDLVVRADPAYPDVYAHRGHAYFHLGNYGAAENDLSRAIEQAYAQTRGQMPSSFQQGGVMLMEIDASGRAGTSHAMLYNNRGAARYLLGQYREALMDFDQALAWDKNLDIAMQNRRQTLVRTGQPVDVPVNPQPGQEQRLPVYAHTRPVSGPQPRDQRDLRNDAQTLREERLEIIDLGADGTARGSGALFKTKPFEGRRVPSRGKLYRLPGFEAASQNYLRVEEVRITPEATFITVKVTNPETKPYEVSVAARNLDDSYYITDRSTSGRRTFRMRDVKGIATYPQKTVIQPGQALLFTLEFPKIPDDMGYINLIEGTKQEGDEWNIYGIDLTK
ncbi:MAG: hypothetical protein OHK0039_48660 [Bacteroidia bacterium]